MSNVLVTKPLCDFIAQGLAHYEVIIDNEVTKRRISYDLLKNCYNFLNCEFTYNFIDYKYVNIYYYKLYDPLLYSCIQYYQYQINFGEDHQHWGLLQTLEEYLGRFYAEFDDDGEVRDLPEWIEGIKIPWGIEHYSDIDKFYDEVQ